MPRQPKPRFVIDDRSRRQHHSNPNDNTYTVLVDGLDRGIRLRAADYGFACSVSVHSETVVSGLRGSTAVLAWLEENLVDLPPLRTEQLEMEI